LNGKDPILWRDAAGQIRLSPVFRDRLIGAVTVYALCWLVWPSEIPLFKSSDRVVWPAANVQVAEAEAWLGGSLALPEDPNERQWDTAVSRGRVFSHFPPLMTLVSAAVMALGPEGVPFYVFSALFVLPIPLLAYVLFLRRCAGVYAAAVLTVAFVAGSSEFFVMCRVLQSGKVWQVNHAASQIGLLLLLIDYFGKRRIWLGGIGLIVCTWTRYTMAVYALPLFWAAWVAEQPQRRRKLVLAAASIGMAASLPMVLNTLKFGHPLDTGYKAIYVGRDDPADRFARDADKGVFSPGFIPRNLYAMNLGFPEWRMQRAGWKLEPNTEATGIWWTTPLLLFLFVDYRKIWRQPDHRVLLAAVAVIYAALMMFHTTGAAQRGYNRFSLDFVLVILAVAAPAAFAGKRRYVSTLLAAWGVAWCLWVGP